jgi:hypothetical protein
MPVIPAVITEDARMYFPQMQGGLVPYKVVDEFRIGEGGWIDPGTGAVPRTPVDNLRRLDNGLQDVDAEVDKHRAALDQRYPLTGRYYYTKALTTAEMSFVSPNKLELRCYLDTSEANNDGWGNPPEFWEIGIFTDHPLFVGQKLMVAYGTFPKQTKTPAAPILNIVRLVY